MSTVVLFVMLVVLIVSIALVFFCYQNQANNRIRELQQERADQEGQLHAAVIYSRPSYPPGGPYNSRPADHRVYPRKFPTPPTITRNLPCVKYDGAKTSSGEAPQCVICCCDYEMGDDIKLLPCMHMFHVECIDLWLERDHSCPICQADIVLAAGLSLHDWSQHTLESINTVSGVNHVPAAADAAAAATAAAEASVPSSSNSLNPPAPSTPIAGPCAPTSASIPSPGTPAAPAAAALPGVGSVEGVEAAGRAGVQCLQAGRLAAEAASPPPATTSSLQEGNASTSAQASSSSRPAAEAAAAAAASHTAAAGLFAVQQQQQQQQQQQRTAGSEHVDAAVDECRASPSGVDEPAGHVALTILPQLPDAAAATAAAGIHAGSARSAAAV